MLPHFFCHPGYDSPGSVLISPVPHQMMSYMNMGSLSRTELQLLNQLHCRRKRRHRTIFTDEQLEALEGLFQETKYPDVGTREQLARKVHLREEKVEVSTSSHFLAFTLIWSYFLFAFLIYMLSEFILLYCQIIIIVNSSPSYFYYYKNYKII